MAVEFSSETSPAKTTGPTVGQDARRTAVRGIVDLSEPGPTKPIPHSTDHLANAREGLRGHVPVQAPASLISPDDASGFGTLLEPVLREACEGRLSRVSWFRADWQRGGALTGYATYQVDDDAQHPVVVKLPVPPCERDWLMRLQPAKDVAPRLYGHGEVLGGYDLAWVVMERLPHGPLGPGWGEAAFDLLIEAAGRFYIAADQTSPPVPGDPMRHDWHALFDKARHRVRDRSVPEAQRWGRCLKKAKRKVKQWCAVWEDRPIDGWCHGDLHLGNAMTRTPAPGGPAILFDFAQTRADHWVHDGVYIEHLFWAQPERLGGRKLCTQLAHCRKNMGLPVDSDWSHLAQAKRALTAMSTPAMLRHDGEPRHLLAALEILEHAVG